MLLVQFFLDKQLSWGGEGGRSLVTYVQHTSWTQLYRITDLVLASA